MPKDRALRNIFIISVMIAVLFPLINIYYIYPLFTKLLVANTEDEAERTAGHLQAMLLSDVNDLKKESLPGDLPKRVGRAQNDFEFIKLKLFARDGEIIYSTEPKDIGEVNKHDYFRQMVAKGRNYSKVVKKDTKSLEGKVVKADVVETYIPIMKGDTFIGAFEIYYDITQRDQQLDMTLLKSSVVPGVIMVIFLSMILTTIFKLNRSISDQKQAKEKLKELADTLKEERDRAQDYLDVAGVMLAALDTNGNVTLINKKGCDILGYAEHEIIGKNWSDNFIPGRLREGTKTVFAYLMSGELSANEQHENPVLTKTGEERLIAWRNTILKDKTGKTIGTLSSGEDITKRKEAEDALRESQQFLVKEHEELNAAFGKIAIAKREWEKTMDCVGDMLILTDSEGKIKRINNAVREFTRKPYLEILDRNWEELIQEQGLRSHTFYSGGIELFQESTGKWFMLSSYPFNPDDLGYAGTVLTLHESTEIKHITEKLEITNRTIEKDREKLQKALDQISALIQNVTNQKGFDGLLSNPKLKPCYEIKNCTKKECICYGKGATRCWQTAGTFCGGNVQGAFAQKYKNCAECEVFKTATSDPISQIGEQFNNMMHVLEMKNRELENAYAELKATQTQILQREKMASIGQLAAGVAHEINNPMGFISSNLGTLGKYVNKLTEFINTQGEAIEAITKESANNVSSDVIPACRESFLNKDTGQAGMTEKDVIDKVQELRKKLKLDYILEDIKQLIKESLDGADRVKRIVQNLKSFSRVDEAEYKFADINECIESTLNIVWNELKYKATVTKEYGAIPQTKCWPQQMNQVFMNLLVNAAHAIEKQGEIKIKTWNGNGSVNISISDTGSGIPADKINKIFEPFFTTKPVGKGTGLGLSITYDIVKKHNGEIAVDSKVGKGTTFTVRIPVVEGDSNG
ncbi:MAG: PAS domain S-box protein [Nitrospirae bacterium]|nr:PAS domain S-box protein [Nitrospirota bacterium]